MPIRDRYWVAKVIGGIATILLAIAFGILSWLLWVDQLFSIPTSRVTVVWSMVAGALLAVVSAVVILVNGVGLWRAGLRARTRYRMRVAAMNGQPDAMPLVRREIASANPADAPDVRSAPLTLTWRATNIAYRVEIPLFGFFAAVFLAFLGFPIYFISLIEGAAPAHMIPLGWALVLYIFVFLLAAACLSVAWLLVRHLLELRRLHGVVATDDGITYYPSYRKPRLLPWHELQLLELAAPERSGSSKLNTFIVYATHGVAKWSERMRNNAFMAYGAPNDELERRQQALLDLIAARTGLQPRSCNRELWETASARNKAAGTDGISKNEADNETDDEADNEADNEADDDTSPDASSKQRIVLLVMGVVSALIILPSAAGIVVAGLTTSVALNVLTAASLLVAYGVAVYAGARSGRRRTPTVATNDDNTSDAQAAQDGAIANGRTGGKDDPQASYAIVHGATAQTRLGFGVAGLALVLCALPGLSGAIGDQARRHAPASALATLPTVAGNDIHGAVAFMGTLALLALGAIGLFFLLMVIRSDRTVIVADADGLRWYRRRTTRRLAWRAIANIEAQTLDGRLIRYAATDNCANVTIMWYADPSAMRALMPHDVRRIGAPTPLFVQPITPRALAALAQERSGVALTHGEMIVGEFGADRE